ncbi:MAG: TRAP transporter small permease [Betaproteobacteria bacterium]|nr:TRAP transporter small permease [Betaproteobacteria bacterium]
MEKAYQLWRAFQEKILGPAAALMLLGSTLLALLEVVRRYAFGQSFYWQQDAVTYIILSAVFLYFGIAQRRESHLTVMVFVEIVETIGPRARKAGEIVRLLGALFSLLFLLAVVWWGIPEVLDSQKYNSRTESLLLPLAPFLWALLIGFVFMAVTMIFQVYRGVQKLRGLTVLEEPVDDDSTMLLH